MTTIAFDGRTLAADTQANCHYIHQQRTRKVRRGAGVVWAVCGDEVNAILFEKWMKGGQRSNKPKITHNDNFCALVVEGGKCWRVETGEMVRLPAGTPAAIGSGSEYAMGAMMAGASAREAVKIAIKLDTHSGGRIDAVDVSDL